MEGFSLLGGSWLVIISRVIRPRVIILVCLLITTIITLNPKLAMNLQVFPLGTWLLRTAPRHGRSST